MGGRESSLFLSIVLSELSDCEKLFANSYLRVGAIWLYLN